MKEISSLLTEDSVINFATGETIKGSEEVADFILKMCESYTDGYMKGAVTRLGVGVALGVAITGGILVLGQIIKSKRESKKLEEEA